MSLLKRSIARIPGDMFLLLLIATVVLAAYFPAHGAATAVVDHGVTAAVSLLFLLYGARLAPEAIWSGCAILDRLHIDRGR
jgi:sodium/bile acid cotransporter 7